MRWNQILAKVWLIKHAHIDVVPQHDRRIVAGIGHAVLSALIEDPVSHVLDVVACIQDFVEIVLLLLRNFGEAAAVDQRLVWRLEVVQG